MGWGGSGHTPARADVRAVGGAPRNGLHSPSPSPSPGKRRPRPHPGGPACSGNDRELCCWPKEVRKCSPSSSSTRAQGPQLCPSSPQPSRGLASSPGSRQGSRLPVQTPQYPGQRQGKRDHGRPRVFFPFPPKNSNVPSHLCGNPGVQLTLGANPPEAGRIEGKRSSFSLPALPFPVRLSSGPRESLWVYDFSHR